MNRAARRFRAAPASPKKVTLTFLGISAKPGTLLQRITTRMPTTGNHSGSSVTRLVRRLRHGHVGGIVELRGERRGAHYVEGRNGHPNSLPDGWLDPTSATPSPSWDGRRYRAVPRRAHIPQKTARATSPSARAPTRAAATKRIASVRADP